MNEKINVLKETENISTYIRDMIYYYGDETSIFICDISQVVKKCIEWKTVFPTITPHYAVKCNDNKMILQTLAAKNVRFDCASKIEIEKVLDIGVDPNKIIFANTNKLSSHIEYAKDVMVKIMTFDNEFELLKIKQVYSAASLVLRFRCDDALAQTQLGIKFGCDPIFEAPKLLKTAKELQLNVIGISFHVGSNSRNPKVYLTALQHARNIFNIAEHFGYNFTLLDIGGGFPGIRSTSIDNFAEIINFGLKKYFPDSNVQVIAEPGRFFVASSGTIAANIHSIKPVVQTNGFKTTITEYMYIINDGCYGCFNMFSRHNMEIIVEPLKKCKDLKLMKSSIWGPTCDGQDKVLDNIFLPQMQIGDWFLFHDMGAYTLPGISNFNGFKKTNVFVVVNECTWLELKELKPFKIDDFVKTL